LGALSARGRAQSSAGRVKFGLALFGVSPRFYAAIARSAEQNGFESVWMPEHLVLPAQMPPSYPYSASGYPPISPDTPLYDPWVVLGYVAHATDSIRLATNVFILPLRHPLSVARSVVTVDRLSNGRVTLGVGVGWLEEEFVAVGQSFRRRGRRTDDMIPLLRRLWSDDVIEEHTAHFDFGPVKFQPKPRQPMIPIEVGGTTPAALRRAGRLGDGWIETGCETLEEAREKLEVVLAARVDAGRAERPFEVSFSGRLGHDVDSAHRCEEAGATRIIATPGRADGTGADTVVDWTKRFGDEVISRM
jgi:probable F420-dependent oxidoreductase